MSHPGRPGKVPGRDGAGQDLETLKLPLALLIYHIYFFPKRANFAIFKSMYVLNSARAWSPSLCKVLSLCLCVGCPLVNTSILLQQSAVHLPASLRLPSLQGRGNWGTEGSQFPQILVGL